MSPAEQFQQRHRALQGVPRVSILLYQSNVVNYVLTETIPGSVLVQTNGSNCRSVRALSLVALFVHSAAVVRAELELGLSPV